MLSTYCPLIYFSVLRLSCAWCIDIIALLVAEQEITQYPSNHLNLL